MIQASTTILKAKHFLNREMSWLEFNQRVLEEALNPENPLLERLKFFCIVSSNLDEFFEVRVAGIKQQIESEVVERSVDGRTATETFEEIGKRVRRLVGQQYACWRRELLPGLVKNGIGLLEFEELATSDQEWLESYYQTQVRPVLTPLAIDAAHPFPQLLNRSLNIMIELDKTESNRVMWYLAVVQVPRILPRLVKLPHPSSEIGFVALEDLVGHYIGDLFPGMKIRGLWYFRLTRNSELYIDDEETDNLLKAVEQELYNRRKGDTVRLELDQNCPPAIRNALLKTLKLSEEDLYLIDGPISPGGFMQLYQGNHSPELRDPPFVAPVAKALRGESNVFAAIQQRDILLHHPYENYSSVVEFLEKAAEDPEVLAIKQTLYRTGGDPSIIGALLKAVRNGKQVTVVLELRARFEEANNIQWSRQLEDAGVNVVYGLVGYKIHGKATLVVRREGYVLRHYVHLATGNYNPNTARFYTDLSMFTCRGEFGEDVANLFNLLTGVCQFQGMKKLIVAPFDLHERMLKLIQREAANARLDLPARIVAKMNSLVDERIIAALYAASKAGVKIDLIVRGICCLRPGLKGLSENITVRSIVDRFLEHSRIFYFENACQPEVFVGSADWMPRNFFRRIEVVFPIEDGNLRARIVDEIMALSLADNARARFLKRDGSYELARLAKGGRLCRSQSEFMALAQQREEPSTGRRARAQYPKVQLAPKPGQRDHVT